MKRSINAIEATGKIESDRRLLLDEALPTDLTGRVRVIILAGEREPNQQEWMAAAAQGGSFDFLKDPAEDIYTLNDGKPFAVTPPATGPATRGGHDRNLPRRAGPRARP